MYTNKSRQLIISLIKDELTNARLLSGLNQMGLNASDYYLQLSDTILKLMGFKNNHYTDEVYQQYRALSEQAIRLEVSAFQSSLDKLADEIYYQLLQKCPK